jgi:hypothetical protein
MPLEQSAKLHLARRVLRVVAPEFRLFVNSDLQPGQCVLDLQKRTVEVGENEDELEAVASVLFNTGHLILANNPDFAEHAGDIGDVNENRLVTRLVSQGIKADQMAVAWAAPVLAKNWNLSELEANELLSSFSWSKNEWLHYYK